MSDQHDGQILFIRPRAVAPAGGTTWAAAQEGGIALFFQFYNVFFQVFRCIFSLVWFVRFFNLFSFFS
jgi:hypothetical protein